MTSLVGRLDSRFYPSVENNWDDSLFRSLIQEYLTPDSVILDLGAGAGIVEQMNFRGTVAKACGVDLDSRVVDNPFLDEGKLGDGKRIPYGESVFDLVFSDNVLEHLDDPQSVFNEVARVLKPGGKFLFKTPNKNHYMPLIARITPHKFHGFVNKLRGRKEVDTFPTRYRANCRRDVVTLSTLAGLEAENIQFIESRPEYTRIFAPLYVLGILYERLVNSSKIFQPLRILLVGTVCKPL